MSISRRIAATPDGRHIAFVAWQNKQRTVGVTYDSRGKFACDVSITRESNRVTEIHAGDVIFRLATPDFTA